MYCYQCEQTAKGTGCTAHGVCGKGGRGDVKIARRDAGDRLRLGRGGDRRAAAPN